MTGVNIIKGKVTLSANLIAAAIKRSGRYNYRVMALTDESCRVEFYEGGQSVGVSEFTMADAKAAGLATGDNWRKFPRNMLFARAISNGAKWYCPDLSGGPLYTPDELGATVDGETGEVIDVPVVVKPAQPAQPASTMQPMTEELHRENAHALGASFEPEPGEDVWADWRNLKDAQAWAMTQGKFNGKRHMENAYTKVKTECKPTLPVDMWRCWYAYVMAHEPAKTATDDGDGWAEVDTHGRDADEPQFN